ncbi:hypothetical protein GE061_014019 [Apolygus lucorum]|uniref:Uncharacterized protein n=1 Tax=Apolygus lucorum TaxID=248454 RepID=A0A6A4KCE6_APOLU|nr:hypothetical protein GE061_014019 [Apolygus lucorum]
MCHISELQQGLCRNPGQSVCHNSSHQQSKCHNSSLQQGMCQNPLQQGMAGIYVTLIEPPPPPITLPPAPLPPPQDDTDDSVYGFGAEWLLAIDYKHSHWRLNQNNNYVISVLKS